MTVPPSGAPGRAKTIAANGDVVAKPYGLGRWHSPRRYACAHVGCGRESRSLAPGGRHVVLRADGEATDRAHNCCGSHPNPQMS